MIVRTFATMLSYLTCLAALLLCFTLHPAAAAVESGRPPTIPKQILVLPTLQWDADGERWRYAAEQGDIEVERALDGMDFGMSPAQVNKLLPHPAPSLSFDDLPPAPEFPEPVRYTWMHMMVARDMMVPVKSCFGAASYIVVLFRTSGLFRVSYRFLPDQNCPNPRPAADELYARFVPIDSTIAFSVHYHTGFAEVVDITDPHAGILVSERWLMPGQ
ncbi:MAG TPA: hypothetical protein VGG99_17965 [Acetobacteraceae bacterium]